MKTLLAFALFSGLSLSAVRGQGTLYFANRDSRTGLDAPIFYPDGESRVSYYLRIDVLAGRDPEHLTPVLPSAPMLENGYWRPQTLTVESMAPGEQAYVQVRAFWDGFGMSYEQAVERGLYHGTFTILPVVLGGDTGGGAHPPTLPASLTGLRPLVLSGVPEPSAWQLALVAGGVLWFAGRVGRRS